MKIGGYHVRLKSYANLFIPILFTAVLIYYMLGSRHIMNTDAMLMAKVVAGVMALSLAFIIKGELIVQKADGSPTEEKKPLFSTREDYVKSTGFALLAFLYIFSLTYVGFTVATLAFLAAAMFFLGIRSVKTLILTPILLTAAIYVLFRIILMVSLPAGIFGV